jgi:hypothetical protein
LTRSSEPLRHYSHKAQPDLTVSDAAKRLTGVLFLVDNSVVPNAQRDPATPHSIIDGFLFENPNTLDCSRGNLDFHRFASDALAFIRVHDDFEHDNY